MGPVLIINEEIDKFRAHLAPIFPEVEFRWAGDLDEARPLADGAEVLMTMNYLLDPVMVAAMKDLKWVQAMVAGIEEFEAALAGRDHVLLTSGRGIHGPQMTENLILHLLAPGRRIKGVVHNQDRHVWDRFTPDVLDNRVVALVGLGAIARHMAKVLKSLGMTVYGVSRTKRPIENFDAVFTRDELVEVAGMVDFLVLVLPYEPDSHHIVNAEVLNAMRPDSYLINVARGGVLDEAALITALNEGRIAGAGLDVFEEGILSDSSPLWDMANVFITPWIGGRSDQYAERILTVIEPNLRHYLAGDIDGMINVIAR